MNTAPAGNAATGKPPLARRPRTTTNPLLSNRRPPPKKRPPPPPGQRPNGAPPKPPVSSIAQGTPIVNPARGDVEFAHAPRSPTPEGIPMIYPVRMSKRHLVDGLRYHVARMTSKKDVDVLDESQYTRPIKLYRRDPAAQPVGGAPAGLSPSSADVKAHSVDDAIEKERERLNAIKAERQRIKEENAKQFAPGATSKKRPNQQFKKKTEQVYRTHETVEEIKKSQLRYEESLPWHLEDFDNKHTWVGSYQRQLSDSACMMVLENDHFRIVPLEKWYTFAQRGNFKHLAPEEVERLLQSKSVQPRFIRNFQEQEMKTKEKRLIEKRNAGLYVRSGGKDEGGEEKFNGEGGAEVDFDDNELFDDDDGDLVIEGNEEDQKEAQKKIKDEQLNANIFDMNDEQEVDKEEDKKEEFEKEQKKAEKSTRKALMTHERNFDYEDSGNENPYSSESEREDSDGDSAVASDQGQPGSASKSKANGGASGTSTRGENTPSGRKKAGAEALLHKATGGIKRSGSPNLSEASGNESAAKRKKKKLDNGASSLSATSLSAKLKAQRDDISGASGTETSGRKKDKLKLKKKALGGVGKGAPLSRTASSRLTGAGSGSESESIRASRLGRSGLAASLPRSGAVSPAAGGSRAASPVGASSATGFPTDQEVLATIPPEGMDPGVIAKLFRARIAAPGLREQWMQLIKRITRFDKEAKKLFRKE